MVVRTVSPAGFTLIQVAESMGDLGRGHHRGHDELHGSIRHVQPALLWRAVRAEQVRRRVRQHDLVGFLRGPLRQDEHQHRG